jgi:hypothetical protein
MKVFISWSGEKSRQVAIALRDWLPGVINSVEPFVSAKDIYAGTRWQAEIAAQLDAANFGIVCVTRDNQSAPWLNFEAGAIAKAVDASRVIPLAIDLKPSDIEIPLGQFQAQPADEAGVREIVVSINAVCENGLQDSLLRNAFRIWWPELAKRLTDIEAKSEPSGTPERSDRELLEETLNTVRSFARTVSGPGQYVEPVPLDHPIILQLRELLEPEIENYEIRHGRGPTLGIRATPRPAGELRRKINELGNAHGIRIVLLPPRRFPPEAPDRPEVSAPAVDDE